MIKLSTGTFKFALRTPTGTLIDCRAGSVIFPVHDGLQGVLRNHVPMLCKLGLGILQVKDIAERENAYFVINGGFARISENNMAILAFDVITFESKTKEEIEDILSKARSYVAGGAYIETQTGEDIDVPKARLIVKMAEMAMVENNK